jgi:L,D-peptidoglycan transpeptidase YkuD (ErfK/YbiS/YcfS/YnhG family)
MKFSLVISLLLSLALARVSPAEGLPPSVRQLVVSIAPSWDSSKGTLLLYERTEQGWKVAPGKAEIPVLYGKNGLVWGRGLLGSDEPGPHKMERDKRAPAGVFAIGKIYTYDAHLPEGANYPFHQVTAADAWVDDPTLPDYNRFFTLPKGAPVPPWFEKQRMRQNDFAYRWLVEIRHNADPPQPGAGSAIFFHIRRGPDRPTSGCTTMAQPNLVRLITWLRADQHPHYSLLPKSEYLKKWRAWGLPEPK